MKKTLITIQAMCIAFALFAQQPQDFKQQMIESGEGQEKKDLWQFANSPHDYKEFMKAKAWNVRSSNSFTNTLEHDIIDIGGRVYATLVDKDNGIALAAPNGGGLWKFNPDNGTNYTPVNDFGSFMQIYDIAQNPFNKQQIIITTGSNGLFISNNGGTSFASMPGTTEEFRSQNKIKFSPSTQNTIYMTGLSETTFKNTLYKSTDAGANWTTVLAVDGSLRSIDFGSGNTVMVGAGSYGIYSSTSGDLNTFSLQTNGILSDATASGTVSNAMVATYAGDRSIAYALVVGSGDVPHIYKTTNGGTSWTEKTSPSSEINFSQSWFSGMIGVHPTNSNIVVTGSLSWGYSTDGGTTWIDAFELEVDYHSVHFHASEPDVAFIGYDQGIGRIDFGETMTKEVYDFDLQQWVNVTQAEQVEIGKNEGFNSTQVYYGDYFPASYGNAFYAGQQDGGSFSHVNGVEKRVIVGDGGTIFVNKQNPNKIFGCTQNGQLYNATANGTNPSQSDFNQINTIQGNHTNFITQFAANDADGEQIYITSNTQILRSLDFGANFSQISTFSGWDDVKVACQTATDPVVYTAGYTRESWNGHIHLVRIANASTSPSITTFTSIIEGDDSDWDNTFYVGKVDHINIDPNNVNSVYLTDSYGNPYKITNLNTGTPSYVDISGNIPDVVFNTVIGVSGMPNTLIAGTNIGLFHSEDGGATWTLNTTIPYTQVTDLRLRNTDKRLFVFTYGRGSWTTTLVDPSSVASVSTSNFTVYPNPTSNVISIKTENSKSIKSVIYDQKGAQVLTSDKKTINLEALKTGIYMIHVLEGGKLIGTEKIVKK